MSIVKATDRNQSEIVAVLRGLGASVQSLHTSGQGVPDLLVGFRGANYLLEVKTLRGRLNRRQVRWHEEWRGQVAVVRTADEAMEAIGAKVETNL